MRPALPFIAALALAAAVCGGAVHDASAQAADPAAFLAGRIFLILIISAAGFNPTDYRTWERGDSGQYLDIAAKGYTLGPSDGSVYPKGDWEGNCGWMPLYPWMIRGMVRLGLNLHAAAMGLTKGRVSQIRGTAKNHVGLTCGR